MDQLDRERRVSRAFVALADTLVDDVDVIGLLDRLAEYCVALLDADAAGILLGDARQDLRPVASSDEGVATMELLQLQAGEGPSLDCFQHVAQVRVPDLADVVDRWPAFVAAADRNGGYRSMYALPLRLRGEAIGAMNLFHRRPGPMLEADVSLAQALADVATIGIMSERAIRHSAVVAEQLQSALQSRVIVEQAKGVIAQSLGVDMEGAFDRLRRYSRSHNLRLGDAACAIADGRLDARSLPPARGPRGR